MNRGEKEREQGVGAKEGRDRNSVEEKRKELFW